MAPKTKIFVGHLPDGCNPADLQALFEKYGTVTECDVINKYGFVHMSTAEEAEAAIKALNNYNFMGSNLSVEPSTSKLHPEPGAPGRAKGGTGPMRRGPPMRNGFSNNYMSDGFGYGGGYSRYEQIPPPREPYFDQPFRERPRPYPSPYERRPMPPLSREDAYARRPLPPPPPPGGPRDDLYARRSTLDEELYERRPLRERPAPDYLYTRRSPPPPGPRYSWYYSSGQNDSGPLPPPPSRRPAFF